MDIETFKKYSDKCIDGKDEPLWFFTIAVDDQDDCECVEEDPIGWKGDLFSSLIMGDFQADKFLKVYHSTLYEEVVETSYSEPIVYMVYRGHYLLVPVKWVFETESEAIDGLNQTALQFFYKAFQFYKNAILKSSINEVVGEFNRSVSLLGDIRRKENRQCKDCCFAKVDSLNPFDVFCKRGYWNIDSMMEFYKYRRCICFLEKEVDK